MKKITLLVSLAISLMSSQIIARDNNAVINNGRKYFVMPKDVTKEDYIDRMLVFKVSEQYRAHCADNGFSIAPLNQLMMQLGASKIHKMFPHTTKPTSKYNKLHQEYADLTLIYEIKFTNDVDLVWAINQVIKTGTVEYAQPRYIQKAHYTPNDYNSTNQSFLNTIKALQAWDIQKGDTNVVIGIVDSGTDTDHPDLVANFKKNYGDPVNGIDDDNDGYKDNFIGWDLAGADYANIVEDNDANIYGDNQNHGSHVSGCASAVTDNGTGVAGAGFNCRLLPVKCGADNDTRASGGAGYILTGYAGIVYAADHGADIINCSWGGSGGGPAEQDVITYATINKDALVLASAGNDNVITPNFPASFNYVINVASVGTSGSADKKSTFSNYGYTVDVCAPGRNIYTTLYNNTYGSMSGTSMASPVAAGGAAIIKSQFPGYSGLQVGEQLRTTCDNIAASNVSSLTGLLGSGRINLYNGVTVSKPSIREQNILVSDNNDNTIIIGDTMRISMDFINYLAPTANATVTLSAIVGGADVTILNGSFTLGVLNTLALKNNGTAPFKVIVKSTATPNELITFKLTYADGTTYSAFEYFDVYVNVDYINIAINQVASSVTSKGLLGYNGEGQTQGIGFTYNGVNTLYESSFMVGVNSGASINVSDMARTTSGTPDADFVSVVAVNKVVSNLISDLDVAGKFNDANNAKGTLPIEVHHSAYAWMSAPYDKFIMYRYVVKNTGTGTLNNLYAGIFCDFDIDDYAKNKGDEDANLRLGYSYATTTGGIYAGVKLLSPSPFIHHAIDNVSGATPVDWTGGGDSDQKKDSCMFLNKTQAGGSGTGNDVMQVVSTGPFTVSAGDSIIVDFAMIAGNNLADIQASSVAAQTLFDGLFPAGIKNNGKTLAVNRIYPNPATTNTTISFNLPEAGSATIKIYDVKGQEVYNFSGDFNEGMNTTSVNVEPFVAGNYFVNIVSGDVKVIEKFTVVK